MESVCTKKTDASSICVTSFCDRGAILYSSTARFFTSAWYSADDVLQYAALELRQCVESIIYEKLRVYKKYVPGVVFEKWQPQHASKMLLQFEPGADESFRMAIREEHEDGVASETPVYVGEYRSLSLSWLEKNYNKLGSYLHVPHTRRPEGRSPQSKKGPDEDIRDARGH